MAENTWSSIISEICENVTNGPKEGISDVNGAIYDILAEIKVGEDEVVWFVSDNITPAMLLNNIYFCYTDEKGAIVDRSQSIGNLVSSVKPLQSALQEHYKNIPLVKELLEMFETLKKVLSNQTLVPDLTREDFLLIDLLCKEIEGAIRSTLFRYVYPEKILEQKYSSVINTGRAIMNSLGFKEEEEKSKEESKKEQPKKKYVRELVTGSLARY